MAEKVTNYQCPSCTGPLHFAGNSGKLECEYCGSAYDVAEIEALYGSGNEEVAESTPAEEPVSDQWGEEAENLCTYSCPSCGAELICDATTAATSWRINFWLDVRPVFCFFLSF